MATRVCLGCRGAGVHATQQPQNRQTHYLIHPLSQTNAPDACSRLPSKHTCAQVVRQAEAGSVGWDVRAANIRGAMRLARGVVVGFGGGGFSGQKQVELLQVSLFATSARSGGLACMTCVPGACA